MYPDPELRELQVRALKKAESEVKSWSKFGPLRAGIVGSAQVAQVDLSTNPAYHTVQFAIKALDPQGALAVATVAEVIWSVQGNQIRRLINVTNGAALSGLADNVNIKIFDASSPAVWAGATEENRTYFVSATMTKGTRPTLEQPPLLNTRADITSQTDPNAAYLSSPIVVASGGGTGTWNVPENVGAISYYWTYAADAPPGVFTGSELTVTEQLPPTGAPQTANIGDVSCANQWRRLYPNVSRLLFTNNHASEAANISVIWGVEG